MYKSVLSFKNIVKHYFLSYFAQNKYMEKLPIFDQNNGLTTLEKSKIFDLFNFFFYDLVFFFLDCIVKHIFKIKTSKKLQILDQTTD